MDASFSTSTTGGVAVLRCRGELDLASRAELAEHLIHLLAADSPGVVVDLTDVEFLDCSSIGALESLSHAMATTRRLTVVCPQGAVRRVLALTGLDETVPVVPALDHAYGLPSR